MESEVKYREIPYNLVIIFLLLCLGIGAAGYIYYVKQKAYIIKEKQNELSAIADRLSSGEKNVLPMRIYGSRTP